MKTLIKDADIIATFDQNMDEIKSGWIYIEDNVIKGVGSGQADGIRPDRIISGKGMMILPGFVNTHHHFYQSLTRAVKEVQSAKLFDWLVFLYEKWKNIDEEAVRVSTTVAIMEMMKSGVTTTTDHHYLFPKGHPYLIDSQMEGAQVTGVRFHPTRGSMCLSRKDGGLPPDSVVQEEEEILKDCERVIEKYHDPRPFSMRRIAIAPCSPFSVTEQLMKDTLWLAEKYDVIINTHVAETMDEDDYCLEHFGLKPVDYMEKLGWLSPRTWFTHMVWVSDEDIKKLSEHDVGMAHCPTSNMRLGSGIAPVTKMKDTGMRIGLGVDGSASNDSGNFLLEIRNALLLQRVKYGSDAITPREALYIGTMGGAKVMRMDKEIGSIEVGKAADIIGFKMDRLEFAGGLSDPVASLVLCDAKAVDFSMINGNVLIENGHFTRLDEQALIEEQNRVSKKLLESD
ncbi:MAG: 8-oxoguanine deaminase [Thermoanaerobacteraceae bacterium]|nr:8-oxoguanine deaminase [Thermoanaerobacteraceae bacterium]